MKRNAMAGGVTLGRTHGAVQTITVKPEPERQELKADPTQTIRKYCTAHLKVNDPEGREILNLNKLVLADELNCEGYATSDIKEVLELLVEAAGEWIL